MPKLLTKFEVIANSHGYELYTLFDFYDVLDAVLDEAIANGDQAEAKLATLAWDRVKLLSQVVPFAEFVLWKREESYIVLARSLESLQSEFPWLNPSLRTAK